MVKNLKRNESGRDSGRNSQSFLYGLFLTAFLLFLAVAALGISIKVQISIADITARLERQEIDLNELQSERKYNEAPTRSNKTPLVEDEIDNDESDYFDGEEEEGNERAKEGEDEAVSKSKKKHGGGVLCGVGSDCKVPRGKKRLTPLGHVQIILKDGDESGYRLEKEMLEDGMRLDSDSLIVPVSGYYFVYSQVQLSDSRANHVTLVDEKPIWGAGSNGDGDSTTSPDYHGGVVRLEANARLGLRLPAKLSGDDLKNSFLGAFYVGNDRKKGKQDDFFFGRI